MERDKESLQQEMNLQLKSVQGLEDIAELTSELEAKGLELVSKTESYSASLEAKELELVSKQEELNEISRRYRDLEKVVINSEKS